MLLQRCDRRRLAAQCEKLPVCHQFILVNLCLCLYKAPLSLRYESDDEPNRSNGKNGHVLAAISMEMWNMVAFGRFRKHPNDDSIKA